MKKRLNKVFWFFLIAVLFCPHKFLYSQEALKPLIIEALEFREVDIKDILRQLAKQYNLNIVFSESVKGLVTVQLNNVSIEQALDSIITVNGFSYTKKENVYKVTTQEEAQREGKQTKLFKLNNADALKLKDTLSKVLSPEGSIEGDLRSNSIIVTDSISVVNKIEGMIPALDELTPQVLIEAKLIETSLTTSEKLGIDWTTTVTLTGAKRATTFPFTAKGGESSLLAPAAPGSTGFVGKYGFPFAAAGDFTLGTLDFTTLQAILDFLKTRTDTKLIAAPRILTINNQKATINVGKVIPIAIYQRNEGTGDWEITGWQDQNVGINLEVTPQISPDGHIRLKLKPEVSNIVDSIGTGLNERPITSTRVAETEVQIRDGQTIVIGGLVKAKESATVKKVPVLGSIPLLGGLFTRKERGSDEEPEEKTDLLIFVTAHIIKDKEESRVLTQVDKIGGAYRPLKLEKRGN
jgi:type IV pilus assembly protein PilQ